MMIFAGAGVSLILFPRANRIELAALSFLFGTAFISMVSFAIGSLITGPSLRWMVAGGCIAIGLYGLSRRCATPDQGLDMSWQWCLLGAIQTIFVSGLAYRRELGWDGLLSFEMKERVALLKCGA